MNRLNRVQDTISGELVKPCILTVRDTLVMLDRDLAKLYQVETRALKQAVKRNANRFPEDFMFVLNQSEVDSLVSQSVIPSAKVLGGARPFAFTEHGIAALSAVLTSDRAIEINNAIIRAFIAYRKIWTQNRLFQCRLDGLERRLTTHEIKTNEQFESILSAIDRNSPPSSPLVFFEGQVFDAYAFINDLIRSAKQSIILIDNFVDDSTLRQLSKREKGVFALVLTRVVSPALSLDLNRHNAQYPPIQIKLFSQSHDRFLIVDEEFVYHLGASLKDLGKKWFALSRLDKEGLKIMDKLKQFLQSSPDNLE